MVDSQTFNVELTLEEAETLENALTATVSTAVELRKIGVVNDMELAKAISILKKVHIATDHSLGIQNGPCEFVKRLTNILSEN